MKKRVIAFIVVALLSSCKGSKGDPGAVGIQGFRGSDGDDAIVLSKTYTGTIPSDGSFPLSVPEITNKSGKTIIQAYWAFPATPSIWTSMADGWIDNTANARIFAVSWTPGTVYFSFMVAGDLYKVEIYTVK